MKQSVCIVVRDGEKWLGVSRKDNHTSFGTPGGKVEEGENPFDAAGRELKEETGLDYSQMVLVDERQWDDQYVYCFVAEPLGDLLDNETLLERGEGIVAWVSLEDLCSGYFGDYNRAVLPNIK